MLRKPRNARTDRLTDWRFFIQIYLVRFVALSLTCIHLLSPLERLVHRSYDVALCNEHVVLIYEPGTSWVLRRYPRIQQVDGRL